MVLFDVFGILDERRNVDDYLKDLENINKQNLIVLDQIIKDNSWIKYYKECEAEIDGWIDFEREIYPVIDLFEKIFSVNYKMIGLEKGYARACINKNDLTSQQIRIARLWDKYIDIAGHDSISIKEAYASLQYGILKKKILKSLRDEFEEFIKAFEIYLLEFVQKEKDINVLPEIKEIEADYVVSVNYTMTENLYGIDKEKVHHIHGMIREDITSDVNQMVMGVKEQERQNVDFIYFVKYFQRIQKKTGVEYKRVVDRYKENKLKEGRIVQEGYLLYIWTFSG